ncbi:Dam family site-specific DNA-(adenine-N6)-methyltransferase [Pantoea sp. CCBC3-3-1]|uniref:Dam family site-specific DNA-(adenine-N6)-methyltransferase n=1 Tax=Pantoea sp. CCBC3-3-1 TaxID=2490851 RepID=UPI0011BF740A|nr:Dam family site-specific DNA-(adenine-N6)-methyltransferase [Pantoea sp. CCBC3-3-1]
MSEKSQAPSVAPGGLSYGSVCSGIEAATVAWHPLGWRPSWFAEIESFPSAVLAHRWPEVPNLGDMTKIAAGVRAGLIPAPDIMVGGTPCQAFSIAGLRKSLDDPRGLLTLSYVDLANAIDQKRESNGETPAIHVWENVPGSLSTDDNAFGYFLAGMVGEYEAFEPGPRPEPGKSSKFWRWKRAIGKHVAKWPKSGCIHGRQRRLAWRVLDAQHFGVAQRRRRVFVVSSARHDIDPAKILFEFDGVRRNSPPSRESRQAVAALTANGVGACGADDNQAQAGHLIAAFGGGNCSGQLDVAACLTARGQRIDFEVETFAVQSATGQISHALTAEGFDASKDGTGRGTPVVAYGSNGHASFSESIGPLHAKSGADHENLAVMAVHGTQDPDTLTELAHTLGRNHGQENAVLAFSSKDYGGDVSVDLSPTLHAGGHAEIHANLGTPPAIVYAIQDATGRDKAQNGKGWSDEGLTYTLDTVATQGVALSVALRGREGGATAELADEVAGTLRASSGGGDKPHVMQEMMVRRLMPVECERLQGFPDAHTTIPWRNNSLEDCPDGPRYKAIGNSMAVPVMRWIGERIGHAVARLHEYETPTVKGKNSCARVKLAETRNRPFLKWAGGKFAVLDTIAAYLPSGDRLIEPFAGAGSVFMNIPFPRYLLADVNPDLMNLYRQLQTSPDTVINTARQLVEGCTNNEAYLAIRDEFNGRKAHAVRHAALFLALNRTCFNGLCRYSIRENKFNVGWCKNETPYFPTAELEAFAGQRQQREFACASFQETIAQAGQGDVIFCDPPYEPMPGTSGFTTYANGAFNFDQQQQLAEALVAAYQRGARAVITNSGAPAIRELYHSHGFDVHSFTARRSVSRDASTRGDVSDVIAIL